jgi:hypothetical protein
VLRRVNEIGDSLAAVVGTPDEPRLPARGEFFARPVGLEARNHLRDFCLMSRNNGIIPRDGQIPGFPIEGLDEANLVVNDHRFLVSQLERRIAVPDFDSPVRQPVGCFIVLTFPAPPRRIEHHSHLHPAAFCRNNGIGKTGVGEQKHPDLNRSLGGRQGIKNRLRGILGKHDQRI